MTFSLGLPSLALLAALILASVGLWVTLPRIGISRWLAVLPLVPSVAFVVAAVWLLALSPWSGDQT
ncbi:MAG: hypothetical protein ACFB11_18725 [Paracoccaceae bacterium]